MNLENKIKNIFLETGTDKSESHGYERYYATIFENYTPKSLLEIGIKEGRSIAAWSILFPNTKISGLDITKSNILKNINQLTNAELLIGDSTKKDTLNLFSENFDVIIDDGSHFYKDILKTFNNFKHKFNDFYIIEDAMYKIKFMKKLIERSGEYSVEILPSKVENVHVDHTFLQNNYYSNNSKKIKINLYMLVVRKI